MRKEIREYGIRNFSWKAVVDKYVPFIDVIPNDKLHDLKYIIEIILKNQKISCTMRKEIREYGIRNFSWKCVVDNYVPFLKSLI
jgi:hypothetical protein